MALIVPRFIKGQSAKRNKNWPSEMFKWSPPKTRKGHTNRVLKPISQLGRVISLCLAGTLTKVLAFTKNPRHMGRNVAIGLNLRVKLLRVNKTKK